MTTVRSVSDESRLHEYPLDALDCRDHVHALLSSFSRYELDLQHNVARLEGIDEFKSVALLRRLADPIERSLWLLEGIATGIDGEQLPEWTPTFVKTAL
jgi:DNA-binding ferritin-like protein